MALEGRLPVAQVRAVLEGRLPVAQARVRPAPPDGPGSSALGPGLALALGLVLAPVLVLELALVPEPVLVRAAQSRRASLAEAGG